MEVLTELPYSLDAEQILSRIQVKKKAQHTALIEKLLQQVKERLSPRALYKLCYIDFKNENYLVVEGTRFTSRILRVNLEAVERLFPYIITCGREFEEFVSSREDLLDQYYLDVMGNIALSQAQTAFLEHLKEKYWLEEAGRMNPGSLEDWPLEEQKPLFSLFGEKEVENLIGVTLEPRLIMSPQKSLSGIAFASKTGFKSCQLCPREHCPGRKAPYDESLLKSYLNR